MDYELNEESMEHRSEENSEADFIVEPDQNRRYYKCFKVNLCLNITMLLTFIGLITMGSWYTFDYSDDRGSLKANFSLLLIHTEATDSQTGQNQYNRYWTPEFPRLCHRCKKEKTPDSNC